jgi:farnesyl-diphosphate farnesyltransferase
VKTSDLGGPLLRSVSRSFYLSIRVLPKALQAPVGLAYLLARASDTIADSADLPGPERESYLQEFLAMVQGGGRSGLEEIAAQVHSRHAGENVLMASIGRCLDWLDSLGEFDRAAIRAVMVPIVHGQLLDVQRFSGRSGVTALKIADELEEYTYLVAGCVGEFWTDVCQHHIASYSSLEPARLRALGRDFGKALQFVNILRDLPADLKEGRCYLPVQEVDAARLISEPASGRECFNRWLARGNALLDSGRTYIESLRPARVRIGCYLPWDLARKTLALLAVHYPLETTHRVKVSRRDVRATMFRALVAAVSNAPLR